MNKIKKLYFTFERSKDSFERTESKSVKFKRGGTQVIDVFGKYNLVIQETENEQEKISLAFEKKGDAEEFCNILKAVLNKEFEIEGIFVSTEEVIIPLVEKNN